MRIMGLDLGEKTIGVAISDPLLLTAQGITVIRRQDLENDLKELDGLKEGYEVKEVVIGLPLMMNGTLGPRALDSQNFAEILQARWGLPVELWDERLSSVAAERILVQADLTRKKRKDVIDKTAASIILQAYLEKKRNEKRSVDMMHEDFFAEEEGYIEVDEETGYVVLKEADGSQQAFFIDGRIEVEGFYYIILIPEEEEEAEEVTGIVFRVEEDEDGSEIWMPVEDDDEFQKVVDALEFYSDEEDDGFM